MSIGPLHRLLGRTVAPLQLAALLAAAVLGAFQWLDRLGLGRNTLHTLLLLRHRPDQHGLLGKPLGRQGGHHRDQATD
ncbi:hypothetical protein D3C81_1489270 [compost metagenome]